MAKHWDSFLGHCIYTSQCLALAFECITWCELILSMMDLYSGNRGVEDHQLGATCFQWFEDHHHRWIQQSYLFPLWTHLNVPYGPKQYSDYPSHSIGKSASVKILMVTMTFILTVIFICICSFHSLLSALIPAMTVISSIVSSQQSASCILGLTYV